MSLRLRSPFAFALVLGVGATAACSLLVDTDGLTSDVRASDAGGFADVGAPDAPGDASADGSADAGTDADAAPARVTDGLVALFTFQEDSGAIVHDIAPTGDKLALLVEHAPGPDGDGGVLPVDNTGPTIAWTRPGMSVVGRVLISSSVNASAIESRCNTSDEITVEAWVKPASLDQYGPARIVTMSYTGTTANRNFTLAQDGPDYILRLRNEAVGAGYVVRASDAGVALALAHVVVTARANDAMTFYVDGARTSHVLPPGAFTFKPFRLALANEIDGYEGERSWRGDYRLVAVYCRALSEAEIALNRSLGPPL